MPELPEVETVARLLRPRLLGRRIERARVGWIRSLGGSSAAAFRRNVGGAAISSVERRGKYVVLGLDRDGTSSGALLVHLRMSGRLHVDTARSARRPYTRVSLALDDGNELRFVDVRKFGRFLFAQKPEEILGELGLEPLQREFTAVWLRSELRRRRRRLKPLLLDQAFVAGLGNIYVDESLHRARLHPLLRSDRVRFEQAVRLRREIRRTLAEAIVREGSSFDAFYLTPEGQPGRYQERFRVYGRQGKPCRRCGTAIRRTVIGQRGTHLCPRCQRAPARVRLPRRRASSRPPRSRSTRAIARRIARDTA